MTEDDRLENSILSFEKALNSWAIIDLPVLQKQLDSNGLEIQSNQKASISSRKELASLTKHFKKLEQEEKLSQINKLLKNYQNEIDSLTKKNKLIENTFFSVYRAIAEAPDPKPLLTLSLDALNSLKELDSLKLQNEKLEDKLLNFADYDQLKKKLAKSEIESKQLADVRVRAKEDEFKSLLEEKELNWYKKEQDMNNSANKLKKQIEEMKVNEEMMKLRLKKSRHFNDEGRDEDEFKDDDDDDIKETIKDDGVKDKTISSMEFELLSRDLDTYKLRTMDLEKRNEELRRELSLTKSEAEMDKVKETNNKRILDLESENALLIAKLERERNILDNLKIQDKKKSDSLTREINQLNLEVDNLKDIKAKTLDYDEVKKELEILKQIEFGFGDDINLEDATDKGNTQIIDSAIVQRNKKLNNEVIEFRSKNEELNKKVNELELGLKDSFKQVELLQEMNNKLESDLLNVENGAVNNDKWETMSMISSIAPSNYTSKKSLSPAASIAGGAPSISGSLIGADSAIIQDSSILPIITQQRDRFRVKNKELEEEGKKQFSKIVELKREMNNLKTDNRELYERIRFLQYHKDQAAKAAAASSNNNNSFTTDIERKYNDSYENELHPIEQFRLMETKRINSKISPFERIFIQAVNVVLSTKATRLLFVGYCFMLHLLVMIMTISMISFSTTTTVSTAAVASTKLTGTTGGVAQGVSAGSNLI